MRQWMTGGFWIGVLLVLATGSARPAAADLDSAPAQAEGGHVLRVDTLAVPAGLMCNAYSREPKRCIEKEAGRDCHGSSPCTKFTYKRGAQFAGVYWWPKACGMVGDGDAWLQVKNGGCAIDLTQPSRLRWSVLAFWARGQKGGEVVSFQVGGQDILPIPARSTGSVRLDANWRRFEIDLTGIDITRMVGLFAWTATDEENSKNATFYLQDIQFEGD